MNLVDELKKLVSLFPGHDKLFASVEHASAIVTSEPNTPVLVNDGRKALAMAAE